MDKKNKKKIKQYKKDTYPAKKPRRRIEQNKEHDK